MAALVRWLAFIPAAVFMAFVTLVEADNLADWLSNDWPAAAQSWPLPYVLGDLAWPFAFVLIGAFVAPAGRLPVAVVLACTAALVAVAAGGSLSLYWVAPSPDVYHKIGFGAAVAGAAAGVLLTGLIVRAQAAAPRAASA